MYIKNGEKLNIELNLIKLSTLCIAKSNLIKIVYKIKLDEFGEASFSRLN